MFNAVPATDWGSPETLEYWRQTWAELCNAKFAEKGLDVSIDHRSYERQGVELLPTVHEGATVRAMEKKGIRLSLIHILGSRSDSGLSCASLSLRDAQMK